MDFKGFGLRKDDPNVTTKRNVYVGGSDVPTILGINQYKSQFELAQEKTGIKPNDFKGNEYTAFGNALEPQIRDYINAVNQTNFIVDTQVDKNHKIRSNVDGVDYDHNLLLEIKTHGKNPNLKVYEVQMQLYMYQLGLEAGWLALYQRPDNFDVEFDADNLQIKEVERNEALIQHILDAIETFWIRCEYLKENPEMDEIEYMTHGTDMDIAISQLNAITPQLLNLKQQIKDLEAIEKKAKDTLYDKMTENDIKKLETPWLIVTRVLPSKTTRFDSKTFKADHPDMYENYTTQSERKGYVKFKEREPLES